jgi:hypothetical protein
MGQRRKHGRRTCVIDWHPRRHHVVLVGRRLLGCRRTLLFELFVAQRFPHLHELLSTIDLSVYSS